MYPGLHQEKRGQQVKGGDSVPLLALVRPLLESRVQLWSPLLKKDIGTVGAGPEVGHTNNPRAGAPLL